MEDNCTPKGELIQLNESAIRDHLGEMVRNTVEDTLNRMLEAEADRLCNSEKYQRREARTDTRAGYYQRKKRRCQEKSEKLFTLPLIHTVRGVGYVLKEEG